MRRLLCVAAVVVLAVQWTGQARAADKVAAGQIAADQVAQGDPVNLSDADRGAIRQIIESQLQAFLRDDEAAAFGFATPGIQSQFQTADIFMQMVRTGYQPVYRPQAVQFKDIVSLRGEPAQRVIVIGPDGVPVMAVYTMTRMPDGTWRISGCFLVQLRENDA